MIRKTIVKEIAFSTEQAKSRRHPEINHSDRYIGLYRGKFLSGRIAGVNFVPNSGLPIQFDPPGTNGCHWQKVWKVIDASGLMDPEAILLCSGIDPVELSASLEFEYARQCREYAIRHRCTSGGVTITEESPIEAWLYRPTADMMPRTGDDDDD